MKKLIVLILSGLFCSVFYAGYAEVAPLASQAGVKTVDMNKDGNPDVIYYSDGRYVGKVEADTNYDGKPDITMHIKGGKFESAEIDTNHDGKPEKKISDVAEFNKWLNDNEPDYYDSLNQPDWQFDLLKF
jgi:hypothetical protein